MNQGHDGPDASKRQVPESARDQPDGASEENDVITVSLQASEARFRDLKLEYMQSRTNELLESIVNPEIDGWPNSPRKQDRGQEGNRKRILHVIHDNVDPDIKAYEDYRARQWALTKEVSRRTRDPALIELNKAMKQSSGRTREHILERENTFWVLWAIETTHSRR